MKNHYIFTAFLLFVRVFGMIAFESLLKCCTTFAVSCCYCCCHSCACTCEYQCFLSVLFRVLAICLRFSLRLIYFRVLLFAFLPIFHTYIYIMIQTLQAHKKPKEEDDDDEKSPPQIEHFQMTHVRIKVEEEILHAIITHSNAKIFSLLLFRSNYKEIFL